MSSSFNGNNGNTNSGRQCVSTSNVDLVPTQSGSNGSQLSPRKSNIDVIEPSPNKNGERYDFTISVNPKNPDHMELLAWMKHKPFDDDFSNEYLIPVQDIDYYGVTELSNSSSTNSISLTKLKWKGLGWYMKGKWKDHFLEGDVDVMNKEGLILMRLKFSKGRLNGSCSFYKEEVCIQGEWKDGECVTKTIPCGNGRLLIAYEHNIPNGTACLCDSSGVLLHSYLYVNGFCTRENDFTENTLYVREGDHETRGYANELFIREGETKIYKGGLLIKIANYHNNKESRVLCNVDGKSVIVLDSNGHRIYEGTYTSPDVFPLTGYGTIYYDRNNAIYKGYIQHGLAHGEGTYYHEGLPYYKGSFKYGLPHGKGHVNGKQEDFMLGHCISTGSINLEYFKTMYYPSLCNDLVNDQKQILFDKVAIAFGEEYQNDKIEYERWIKKHPVEPQNSPIDPPPVKTITHPQRGRHDGSAYSRDKKLRAQRYEYSVRAK